MIVPMIVSMIVPMGLCPPIDPAILDHVIRADAAQ